MLQEIANHLWQSTLFLCCIAVLSALLRKEDARIRYWLWWVASIKFLVPFSTLAAIGAWFAPSASVELMDLPMDWVATVSTVSQPFIGYAVQQEFWSVNTLLLCLWATGSFFVLGVWAVRANRIRQLVKGAEQESNRLTDQGRAIPIYRTKADIEPGVIGLLRPALLLPQGIENRLSAEQVEAVLAHELCHIRRRDNLTAALHMLVEAVFWFHPMIWWLGFRLIDERERACDEMVVTLGHDREIYAQSILDVCEQYVTIRLACAPGISGSDLKRRVVKIMNFRGAKKMENTKKLLLSTLFFFALALPISGGLFMGVLAQELQGVRPISEPTKNALEPVRQALSPKPEAGDSEPEPNPQLALQELQRINIDRLPSHEKAEVYFLYGYTYYLLRDMHQVLAYWQQVIDEPEANAPLIGRTIKSLAQVHMMEEEYDQALELYLEWMSNRESIGAPDYALLGTIYFNLEDEDNALEYIERAINMREANGEAGQQSWYDIQRTILDSRGNSAAVVESQQGVLAQESPGQGIEAQASQIPTSSGSGILLRPLVVVQPDYPRLAAERGLEGYCVVRFTITTSGSTKDVQPVECTNALFQPESIQAAEQLKYSPIVVDGQAIEEALFYKFTYEMTSG